MDSIGFISLFLLISLYLSLLFCITRVSFICMICMVQCLKADVSLFSSLSFIRFLRSIHSYGAHQTIVCCAAYECMLRRKQMIHPYETDGNTLYCRRMIPIVWMKHGMLPDETKKRRVH